MATKTPRTKATESAKAAARREAPRDFWLGRAPRLPVGEDRWQVFAYRGAGRPPLDLSSVFESADWTDASAILEGSITLRMPPRKVDLSEGHVIVLKHARTANGTFREVWRMRIASPSVSYRDGGWTMALQDDLALLKRSKDDWDYRKSKKKPRGWLSHEIVADVARRYGFTVGRIPRGRERILKLVKTNASPYDVILAALLKEKQATKENVVLGWSNGKLTVDRLHRSAEMLVLGPLLIDATYQATLPEGFATELTVHGTTSPKKGKKVKVERRVVSRAAQRRYGKIHQRFKAEDIDSVADAVRAGKRQLAELAKPQRELSVTVPGTPRLRRGAAARIVLPDIGLRAIVFAKEVRHAVGPGSYTIDLVCDFTDPYRTADQKALEKKQKAAIAKGRKPPARLEVGETEAGKAAAAARKAARAKPKKAKTREEKT